ncbi:effector-associated constant component EACC1 [Streptomyces sviceus]|uniref:effector-associated constant component EACC1 n=1 Tax=Streptomyces sviceus TaxID=285530 RepID=UPI0036C6DF88
MPDNHTGYLISVVDDDPLRARKDARELLATFGEVDPTAKLDLPEPGSVLGAGDKGGPSAETVGLLLSAGSFVVALVQTWLARVPQRTIVVKRPDGATLHITGKEAREDDTLVERFLADDGDGRTTAAPTAPTAG